MRVQDRVRFRPGQKSHGKREGLIIGNVGHCWVSSGEWDLHTGRPHCEIAEEIFEVLWDDGTTSRVGSTFLDCLEIRMDVAE